MGEQAQAGDGGSPEPPDAQRRAQEQLSAVRLLLQSKRHKEAHDVLIATAFEVLASGPKTTDEIISAVRETWRGVSLPRAAFDLALDAAEQAKVIVRSDAFGSVQQWQLASQGEIEIQASKDWAADIIDRCREQLRRRAVDELGVARDEDVTQWMQIVLDALVAGIGDALIKDPRNNLVIQGQRLCLPSHYDLDKVFDRIAERCRDADVCRFLNSVVIASLDPASDLGGELVHYIAVGYLLYNYLLRRDLADAAAKVGSLAGQTIILDTPVLLMLLSERTRPAVADGIAQAASAGLRVVLLEETVDELTHLLDSKERSEVKQVERALSEGTDVDAIRATFPDQIVSAWLSHGTSSNERMIPWARFREQAASLPKTLQAIGTSIGEQVDLADVGRSASHVDYQERLREQLETRNSQRSPHAVRHDASMLLMLDDKRRGRDPSSFWPGGFIVTPDSFLDNTFDLARGPADFPACLTLGQFLSVLANVGKPEDVEALAQLTSQAVSAETHLMRSVRVPPDTALAYAKSMTGSAPSALAVEAGAMQLSLEELIRDQPDLATTDAAAQERLAVDLIAHRSRQQAEAMRHHREASDEARRVEKTEAAVAQAEAAARLQAETDRAVRAEQQVTEKDAERSAEARGKARWRRGVIALGVLLPLLLIATALGATGTIQGRGAVLMWLGVLACVGLAIQYVADDNGNLGLLLGCVIVDGAINLLAGVLLGGN